ncbi:hypothetical protein EJB05_12415, partial [Eragrostis curvula]
MGALPTSSLTSKPLPRCQAAATPRRPRVQQHRPRLASMFPKGYYVFPKGFAKVFWETTRNAMPLLTVAEQPHRDLIVRSHFRCTRAPITMSPICSTPLRIVL